MQRSERNSGKPLTATSFGTILMPSIVFPGNCKGTRHSSSMECSDMAVVVKTVVVDPILVGR